MSIQRCLLFLLCALCRLPKNPENSGSGSRLGSGFRIGFRIQSHSSRSVKSWQQIVPFPAIKCTRLSPKSLHLQLPIWIIYSQTISNFQNFNHNSFKNQLKQAIKLDVIIVNSLFPGSAHPKSLDPDLGSTDPISLDPDLTDPVGSLVVRIRRRLWAAPALFKRKTCETSRSLKYMLRLHYLITKLLPYYHLRTLCW